MRFLRATACLLACWAGATRVAAQGDGVPAGDDARLRIEMRGTLTLPEAAADAAGRPVKLTGMSGVAWLGDDAYVAVLDNSDVLCFFTLELARDGRPVAVADLRAVRVGGVHDFEDVAVCPEPLRERIARRRLRRHGVDPGPCLLLAEEDTPAIRAVSRQGGDLLGIVPLPAVLAGRRPNRGLEALAVDPDDGSIWTANEEAVATDGPPAGAGRGTTVRIVRVPLPADPPRPTRQYAYAVDPPHEFIRVAQGEPLAGVVAVVPLGGGRLLVLERAAGPGLPPFMSRICLVDTTRAADVSAVERDLAAREDQRLEKRLLWEEPPGCNLEGLCLGPRPAAGGLVLVAVADNGGLGMPTRLVTLVLSTSAAGRVTSP